MLTHPFNEVSPFSHLSASTIAHGGRWSIWKVCWLCINQSTTPVSTRHMNMDSNFLPLVVSVGWGSDVLCCTIEQVWTTRRTCPVSLFPFLHWWKVPLVCNQALYIWRSPFIRRSLWLYSPQFSGEDCRRKQEARFVLFAQFYRHARSSVDTAQIGAQAERQNCSQPWTPSVMQELKIYRSRHELFQCFPKAQHWFSIMQSANKNHLFISCGSWNLL